MTGVHPSNLTVPNVRMTIAPKVYLYFGNQMTELMVLERPDGGDVKGTLQDGSIVMASWCQNSADAHPKS